MLVVLLLGTHIRSSYVFRLCPHPLLRQCRTACYELFEQYPPVTRDLELSLLPKFTQLVHAPEGHRICLCNWISNQLLELSAVLILSDLPPEAITAVLVDVFRTLVKRVDALWEVRKQGEYIKEVDKNASAFPAKYKPFSPHPIEESTVFYRVRLGKCPSRIPSGSGATLCF